nr:hypothetical protein [Tanacetum cinerariifolium]
MIAYLTKSDASEGFNQIIDFLNGSSIKYTLTINPNIYVSSIKQFWTSVAVKKVNDVTRLQALFDKKKNVIITKATIRDALHAEIKESSDVQGRKVESQAQIYQIDLEHADKVLSMQDVDIEPAELQEVLEVFTTAKLITEVVTAASATIPAAAP